MQATFELSERVLRDLEALALEEGTTPERVIEQLLAEHGHRRSPLVTKQQVRLPLIPIAETGPIKAFSGADLDDIFAREDLAS